MERYTENSSRINHEDCTEITADHYLTQGKNDVIFRKRIYEAYKNVNETNDFGSFRQRN